MRSKMLFDQPLPVGRIVSAIGESKIANNIAACRTFLVPSNSNHCSSLTEAQKRTVMYGERPFGVGLLVIGYDVSTECHSL
jgi:hypothetical protein